MRKNPKLKGLRVPRIFIWILGVIHGKILKTGGIDPDTGQLCSGYIQAKCKLFSKCCAEIIQELEKQLKNVRSEAAELVIRAAFIRKSLAENAALEKVNSKTIADKRKQERLRQQKTSNISEYQEILSRLIAIDEEIRSTELLAEQQLQEISRDLESRFATYGHGVLLKPIYDQMIPSSTEIMEDQLQIYRNAHRTDDEQRRSVLMEVYSDEI